MRILVALTVATAIVALPAAAEAGAEFGIGGQSAGYVQGLSVKAKIAGPLTLQGIVGYSSVGMENPTVEVEGENQEDLPMTFTNSTWALGGRALLSVVQTGSVDVYVGAGFMYHMKGGTLEVSVSGDDAELTLDGSATEFSGMFGVEYRFDDLRNAALSAEVGYSYMMYGSFEGTVSASDEEYSATLDPNAKEHGFYVGAGVHYYF